MRDYINELDVLIRKVVTQAKKPVGFEAILQINFPIEYVEDFLAKRKTTSDILGNKFNSFNIAGSIYTIIESDHKDAYLLNRVNI